MRALTTMQIAGFQGDVFALDHDGYDEARAAQNDTVDVFHANRNMAPATRR